MDESARLDAEHGGPVCVICKRLLLTDYELELGVCARCDHRADMEPDWFARKQAEYFERRRG